MSARKKKLSIFFGLTNFRCWFIHNEQREALLIWLLFYGISRLCIGMSRECVDTRIGVCVYVYMCICVSVSLSTVYDGFNEKISHASIFSFSTKNTIDCRSSKRFHDVGALTSGDLCSDVVKLTLDSHPRLRLHWSRISSICLIRLVSLKGKRRLWIQMHSTASQ